MTTRPDDLIMVDAHVHLHRCFDLGPLLDAAYANFRGIAHRLHPGRPFVGVLLLTESRSEHGFDRLRALRAQQHAAGHAGLGGWRLHPTDEDTALYCTSRDDQALVVVAGRQIQTQEKLEVLAIGTRHRLDEGRPIEDLIRAVASAGALPIVPWGFGKWAGTRGDRVRALVRHPSLPPFFLGDNANRPARWPLSSLFRLAEERGIRNLPGSDPLPFSSEYRRPGCYGFALQGPLDLEEPTRDLKRKVADRGVAIHPFGTGETPVRFLRNQLAMHYLKLTARGRSAVP